MGKKKSNLFQNRENADINDILELLTDRNSLLESGRTKTGKQIIFFNLHI